MFTFATCGVVRVYYITLHYKPYYIIYYILFSIKKYEDGIIIIKKFGTDGVDAWYGCVTRQMW